MKFKTQKRFLFVLVAFFITNQNAFAGKKDELIKEMIKGSDVSIEFYGKVLDQYGQPVVGANVIIHYSHYNSAAFYGLGATEVTLISDLNGKFELKEITGSDIYIPKINLRGYEWRHNSDTVRIFEYTKKNDRFQPFQPDINNPVVFQLYKKPAPGFVVAQGESVLKSAKDREYLVNLIEGFNTPYVVKGNRKWLTDFSLTVKKDEKKENFIFELKSQSGNGGFVINTGELRIAPEEGYQPSITRILKPKDEIDDNYYCKFSKGAFGTVYAFLKLKLSVGTTEMSLRAYLHTNIEGKRNLEYDRDFTVEEMSKFAGHTVEYNSDEYRQLIPEILMKSKTISTTTTSI